jgi:hypothetical protein
LNGGKSLEKKTEIAVPEKPKSLLGEILEHSQSQDDKFLAVHKESQALLRQILTEVRETNRILREERGRLK